MQKEIWKPIIDFIDFYEISTFGNIRSIKCNKRYRPNQSGINIKKYLSKFGYYQVTLTYYGKRFLKRVNRLVAEAFIPNPENKPCVNHINGNKIDNNIYNLEWVTYSENEKHSYSVLKKNITGNKKKYKKGINPKCKKIYCNEKNIEYMSIKDAAISLNVEPSNISAQLRGKIKKTGGFSFKYI